jgi:hypothetical protein
MPCQPPDHPQPSRPDRPDPDDARIVYERQLGDHVAPTHWWAFTSVWTDGRLAWQRRYGGPRLPEPIMDPLGPWSSKT